MTATIEQLRDILDRFPKSDVPIKIELSQDRFDSMIEKYGGGEGALVMMRATGIPCEIKGNLPYGFAEIIYSSGKREPV